MTASPRAAAAVGAAVLIIAGWAPHALASPTQTLTVAGATGTFANLTLARPATLDPRSLILLTPTRGFTALLVEQVATRQVLASSAVLHDSQNVIASISASIQLPAGRYRMHLLGSDRSARISIGLSGQPQSLRTGSGRSRASGRLTALSTAEGVAGNYTQAVRLRAGQQLLVAYRLQARAAPAGAIDVSIYKDAPRTDPNTLLPLAGGPIPFATTYVDGVEAVVYTSISQNRGAAPGAYRASVRAAVVAAPRFSEALTVSTDF